MPLPFSVWFLGTSSFAVPSLEALARDPRFSVDLVITQPDRPVGRKQVLTPPPIKETAERLGLKIMQPTNINKHFAGPNPNPNPNPNTNPDFLVVVSFGQLLSQQLLDLPRVAPVNVHASLLPRWRGASPIHHAILAGDTESGVTVQKMVKELDAGPILAQEPERINPRDTYVTLHDRLAAKGSGLLIKTLTSTLRPVDQDRAGITLCRKLTRADGIADPKSMTAEEIDRKVRALNPWPSVTIGDMKILETSLQSVSGSSPLNCKNGTVLHLISVQPAGGKPMIGSAWARGNRS